MPAIVLVMGKKEGCNKMSKKTHFVTAPFGAPIIGELAAKGGLRGCYESLAPNIPAACSFLYAAWRGHRRDTGGT